MKTSEIAPRCAPGGRRACRIAAGLLLAVAGCASTSREPSTPSSQAPARRIRICSDKKDKDWSFCGREGPISEEEFRRRYTNVTGSAHLGEDDSVPTNKLTIVGGSLTAGAGALCGIMVIVVARQPEKDVEGSSGSIFALPAVLMCATASVGALALLAGVTSDASPTRHVLTREEAERAVRRYNATLEQTSRNDWGALLRW